MKPPFLSSTFQVRDGATAAAFSHPVRRRALLLLAARERSLSELARDADVDLKRLHYHVVVLTKAGLVVVSRTVARAGRPIRVYAAVAGSFFVPASLTAVDPADVLASDLRAALARARRRTRDGIVYDVDERGLPRMRAVSGAGARPAVAVERWWNLSLTVAERAALAEAIDACVRPYAAPGRRPGERCLVHFAVAPADSRPAPGNGRRRPNN